VVDTYVSEDAMDDDKCGTNGNTVGYDFIGLAGLIEILGKSP